MGRVAGWSIEVSQVVKSRVDQEYFGKHVMDPLRWTRQKKYDKTCLFEATKAFSLRVC